MATTERVTVTLPLALLAGIDRYERNRSRFIAEAVARELDRRKREGLYRSLAQPHPEGGELADLGLAEWRGLKGDEGLVAEDAGREVRWVEGRGWEEESE